MIRVAAAVMAFASVARADEPQFTVGAVAIANIEMSTGLYGNYDVTSVGLAGSYRVRPHLYLLGLGARSTSVVGDDESDSDVHVTRAFVGIGWEHWGDVGSVGAQLRLGYLRSTGLGYDDARNVDFHETANTVPIELRFPLRLRLAPYAAIEVAAELVAGKLVGSGSSVSGPAISIGVYATL